MNQTLEKTFEAVRQLPEHQQAQIEARIQELVSQIGANGSLEEDLKDSSYGAYVQNELFLGMTDVRAGNLYSAEEIVAQSNERLKKRYG